MKILAIDPGNIESAYVLMGDDYRPLEFGKAGNYDMRLIVKSAICQKVVIEMVASYGMAVGKEVFETCVWIGQFKELSALSTEYVYRKDVKLNLCGQTKAKDSNIIQALKDRFGDRRSKKNPTGFFPPSKENGEKTGWADDVWQAYAVGVTYLDGVKNG